MDVESEDSIHLQNKDSKIIPYNYYGEKGQMELNSKDTSLSKRHGELSQGRKLKNLYRFLYT